MYTKAGHWTTVFEDTHMLYRTCTHGYSVLVNKNSEEELFFNDEDTSEMLRAINRIETNAISKRWRAKNIKASDCIHRLLSEYLDCCH